MLLNIFICFNLLHVTKVLFSRTTKRFMARHNSSSALTHRLVFGTGFFFRLCFIFAGIVVSYCFQIHKCFYFDYILVLFNSIVPMAILRLASCIARTFAIFSGGVCSEEYKAFLYVIIFIICVYSFAFINSLFFIAVFPINWYKNKVKNEKYIQFY